MKISEQSCMILTHDKEICVFPSEKVLNVLGKKYTLLIIVLLGNKPQAGFNEISKNIGTPRANIVSQRLKELETLAFVRRHVIENKRPLNVEYSLTEKGIELRKKLIPLFRWIEKNGT